MSLGVCMVCICTTCMPGGQRKASGSIKLKLYVIHDKSTLEGKCLFWLAVCQSGGNGYVDELLLLLHSGSRGMNAVS